MKTLVICKYCSIEGKVNYQELEVETSGIYEFRCDKGHENISVLQLHQFQILYDLGIYALLDGYTREAVTSFAVSLERFYEYCIDCFLYGLPEDIQKATRKYVSSQSERQLGAFYYLYLSKINDVPERVKDDWVKFRNRIVHKGEIPKYEKALEYANYIYHYINDTLEALYSKFTDSERFFTFMEKRRKEILEKHPKHQDAHDPSTFGGITFIEIFPHDDKGPDRSEFIRSFDEKFEIYKGMNEHQKELNVKRLF